MFIGIGEAGYGPAAPTLISDAYSTRRRASALAVLYLALPIGSALGYMLGGTLSSHFNSWRAAFLAVTPPGLLLAFLCLFMRDPRNPKVERRSRARHAHWRDYLELLRNRSWLLDSAGMALMTFAIGGIQLWMPTYLIKYRQVGGEAHVNTVFGIVVASSGLIATILGGWVSDKLAERFNGAYFWVSGLGILLSCPFVLLMLKLPFPAAWWAIFAAVFFLMFNTGPSNTILANVTRPTIRATGFAVNILIIHVFGDAISPPVIGAIVGKNERWNLAFSVMVVIMASAGVLWLWGAQFLVEDTRRATERAAPA
jgi:MFS family permease